MNKRLTHRYLSILFLALLGCDSGGSPAVDAHRAPDGQMVDGGVTDAAGQPDLGRADMAACSPTARLEVEHLQWFWWAGTPAPTARVPVVLTDAACAGVVLEANVPWLEALWDPVGAIRISAQPGALASGRHHGEITLLANGQPLAQLEVSLALLREPMGERRPKVLVIGFDGVRSDGLARAATPHLDRLAAGGVITYEASTQRTGGTVSGPGWTSILTGVEVAVHGVEGNGDLSDHDPRWPTFLKRAHDLGFGTAAACQWAPLLTGLIELDALDWRGFGDQALIGQLMTQQLREADFDVHFAHLDDPDHAGHDTGYGPDNPDYIDAIERADAEVGHMFEAILDRPEIATEDWLFVFTTDHGGRGTGHGPQDRVHQRIPFLVAGARSDATRLGAGVSHMDTHPTVMTFLGHPSRPEWALDGRAVGLAMEAECYDDIDDDGDGALDCADSDCACPCAGICTGQPPPEPDCPTGDLAGALGEAALVGDTSGGDRAMGDCGGVGPEVSYTWQAPAADTYAFTTLGAAFDTVLSLRATCGGPPLICNADIFGNPREDVPIRSVSRVERALEAGEEVVIVVDGQAAEASGAFQLNIHGLGAECGDEDLGQQTGPAVATGNNEAAPTRYGAPCAGSARDHSLLWAAPDAGTWRFDSEGSSHDTVLWLLPSGCVGPPLGCSDDAEGLGLGSRVEVELVAGQSLVVVVAGFRGRAGDWQLNIARVE